MLDLIDNVTTGKKRFVTVARADTHPDSHGADLQIPDPVHARRMLDSEALLRLRDDPFTFLDRQRLERFVFEMADGKAFVVVAHPTLEGCVATRARIGEPCAHRRHIDGFAGETECAHDAACHPPATGGMNTIESSLLSDRDQSPNSELIATRSISTPSEKG